MSPNQVPEEARLSFIQNKAIIGAEFIIEYQAERFRLAMERVKELENSFDKLAAVAQLKDEPEYSDIIRNTVIVEFENRLANRDRAIEAQDVVIRGLTNNK